MNAPSFALRPNVQGFDEIRIVTIPRYKESELSGDEWRISSQTQFYRKGELVHTTVWRNVEVAAGCVYADMMNAFDAAKGYFAGDGIHCDQEGCSERKTVTYRKLFDYDNRGHKSEITGISLRCFCNKHKTRGDCGLDDADDNYEIWDPKENQ